MQVTHVSVNDGTIEGMRHKNLPIFIVQFHPEAYLTEHGVKMVENWMKG